MRTVKVKICGLTRKEDLAFTVAAGADAVGFLVGVPASPRNLSIEKAKTLVTISIKPHSLTSLNLSLPIIPIRKDVRSKGLNKALIT